jgi:chromosome segregation ATPase
MSLNPELKKVISRIETLRSQIEECRDDLNDLWVDDIVKTQDSIWSMDDAIEQLHGAVAEFTEEVTA